MERRKFVKKSTLATIAGLLGTEILFGDMLPKGYQILGLQDPDPFKKFQKDVEMVLLNDRPLNMEAQAHLLDDGITPNKYMFIRTGKEKLLFTRNQIKI